MNRNPNTELLLTLISEHPDWGIEQLETATGMTHEQVIKIRSYYKCKKANNKEGTVTLADNNSVEKQLQNAKDALNAAALREKELRQDYNEMCERHMRKAEECERIKQENARLDGLCHESKQVIEQNVAQLKADKIDIDALRAENEHLHAEIVELKNSPRQIVSDPELQQKYNGVVAELEALEGVEIKAAAMQERLLKLEKIETKYNRLLQHYGELYITEEMGLTLP